ncbi:ATP-binding protein [Thermosipho atlanticus]|uniref:ATP-dependent DNA helicase RecG n=1 Tax=Thermosipho atlanticus DSM 15807 TaxID=1123380 RepID=A0A1M5RBV4_9BACT|nr:ATP-binding protein [Thermosipho atlanticus]SHH23785.1 ATP-dependent DNA helicase RecG [Thermosipho atlanticus DSM 15807]
METHNIEYKESFGDSVLKAICEMANANGGVVIVGISDNGTVKGLKITNRDLEKITEKIVSKLGIHPEIELKEENAKTILVIKVSKSNVPISFNGRYYERVGNTTREMKPEKLRSFLLRGTNWDSIINENAEFNEIDEETVRMFLRMAKAKGRLTIFDENVDIKTLFEHLKLTVNGRLTNGAIILFGKDPQKYFINAVLRVIRLKNEITPIGDRFIDGNLFKQVVMGEEVIKNFINVKYEIKKLVRKEIWDYPLEAIREALLNALIHRDYFRWNVQTQIKIFDDYIWFYNIGGLPEGITLEQLKGPHSSVPRNPLIVHIFYLAGFIEEMGSGTGRIIESMKSAGLPVPEFKEEMGGFSVYFRKDIYTEEYLKELGLNERQIKAVMYVKEKGRITNREYQKLTGISRQMVTIDLKQLVENGVFVKIGKAGAGVAYELTKLTKD